MIRLRFKVQNYNIRYFFCRVFMSNPSCIDVPRHLMVLWLGLLCVNMLSLFPAQAQETGGGEDIIYPEATPLILDKKERSSTHVTLQFLNRVSGQRYEERFPLQQYHLIGNSVLYVTRCKRALLSHANGVEYETFVAYVRMWKMDLQLAHMELAPKPSPENIDTIGEEIFSAWMYQVHPELSKPVHELYDIRLMACGT